MQVSSVLMVHAVLKDSGRLPHKALGPPIAQRVRVPREKVSTPNISHDSIYIYIQIHMHTYKYIYIYTYIYIYICHVYIYFSYT